MSDDENDDGGGDDDDDDDSEDEEVSLSFDPRDTFTYLKNLALLPRLTAPLTTVLTSSIVSSTKNLAESYSSPQLPTIALYTASVIKPWLEIIVGEGVYKRYWEARVNFTTQKAFCEWRIKEMFEIVADWPDSEAAVVELRDAVFRTSMHKYLATELRKQLQARLLHPGARTAQIIDVYVSTIKVLRVIDPTDVLLRAVAEPVRIYLKNRSDTVRCIVTSLTDENGEGELSKELRMQGAKPLDNVGDDDDDENPDGDDFEYEEEDDDQEEVDVIPVEDAEEGRRQQGGNLVPPEVEQDQLPLNHHQFYRKASTVLKTEVLSMLVGIYGSKELFINEYRLILADKLLSNTTFDTDQEVQNLELLKLRFGESSCHYCEIMLKDIYDSRRINKTIHETIRDDNRVNVAIISDHFWPTLQSKEMKIHPSMQQELKEFSDEYTNLKNPRKLEYLSQLGLVELDLELADEHDQGKLITRSFSVSPVHATLIAFFGDRETWTAADLSNECSLPIDVVVGKMVYWVNQRVVRLVENNTYSLGTMDVEEGEGAEEGEDEGGFGVDVDAQLKEEMLVYESYVTGMLTNLGVLPLGRIHNMLKMFVTGENSYDKSEAELAKILQFMVREERLEFADGVYSVKR